MKSRSLLSASAAAIAALLGTASLHSASAQGSQNGGMQNQQTQGTQGYSNDQNGAGANSTTSGQRDPSRLNNATRNQNQRDPNLAKGRMTDPYGKDSPDSLNSGGASNGAASRGPSGTH